VERSVVGIVFLGNSFAFGILLMDKHDRLRLIILQSFLQFLHNSLFLIRGSDYCWYFDVQEVSLLSGTASTVTQTVLK
jgi:hypothetical protein